MSYEKKSFVLPAAVGAGVGALASPEGKKGKGAFHGAVTGAGTDIGGAAGMLAGGALGSAILPGPGTLAGGALGLPLGAFGGFKGTNALQRMIAEGPLPYDADYDSKKSKKPKDGDGDGKVNDGTPEEKEASSCSSHSKPKKKKSKKVEKAALELATKVAAYRQVQEKQARVLRIKLAAHVVRMDTLRRELDKYDPYQLSKSAAIGAHKADRMKAAALVRQIELEKQAFLGGLVGGIGRGLVQGGAKAIGGAAAGGLKAGAKAGLKGAYQGAKAGAKAGYGVDKAVGRMGMGAVRGAGRMAMAPTRMAGRAIQGGAKGMRNGQGVAAGARSGLAQGFKKDPLAATAALGGTAMAGGAMAQQGYDKHLKQPMQQMAQQAQQIPQQVMNTANQYGQQARNYGTNIGNAIMGRNTGQNQMQGLGMQGVLGPGMRGPMGLN